jgi:hypothetical protein
MDYRAAPPSGGGVGRVQSRDGAKTIPFYAHLARVGDLCESVGGSGALCNGLAGVGAFQNPGRDKQSFFFTLLLARV